MSEINEINSENVMYHPLFRMIMRSVVVMPNNNIEQRSFDQQIKRDTPCTDEFIEELETTTKDLAFDEIVIIIRLLFYL